MKYTDLVLVNPCADDMIESTLLPEKHKDPFDRLLIAQARSLKAMLVTKDKFIKQYDVNIFWL